MATYTARAQNGETYDIGTGKGTSFIRHVYEKREVEF